MPKRVTQFLEYPIPPKQSICPIKECKGIVKYSLKHQTNKCNNCGAEVIYMVAPKEE